MSCNTIKQPGGQHVFLLFVGLRTKFQDHFLGDRGYISGCQVELPCIIHHNKSMSYDFYNGSSSRKVSASFHCSHKHFENLGYGAMANLNS